MRVGNTASVVSSTANGVRRPQIDRIKSSGGRSSTTCGKRRTVASRLPAVAIVRARRDRYPALFDDRSHLAQSRGIALVDLGVCYDDIYFNEAVSRKVSEFLAERLLAQNIPKPR